MWIAIDKDGSLHIFDRKPWRETYAYLREPASFWSNGTQSTLVKDESIKKRFDYLTWEDEPIEIDIIIKNNFRVPVEKYCRTYDTEAHTLEGD